MRSHILPIVSLLTSTFFMMAGAGLQGILLPVRGAIEQWSAYEIGLLGTGYAVFFTSGCLIAPRLVRSAGHVRTFCSLAALLAIAILLHAMIVHPIAWILLRGVSGFALAGSYMIIESWLNERVTNQSRGTIFSLYMMISMAAMMSGQYVLPLSQPQLTIPFMVCAIFFCLAVIPNALSRAQSPKPLTQVRLDLPAIFRNSPAAAIGVFLSGVLASAWSNMAPVFGADIGFSTTSIATLLVCTMAGGMIFQYPLGRLSDRLDRRLVLCVTGIIGVATATLAIGLSSTTPAVLFILAFLLGGTIYPAYSLAVAHANDFAAPADFVKISGGMLILYGFGTMGGPLLAAWLMENYGPMGIFLATGTAHAALAAYSIYRTTRRQPVPAESREDFRSTPLARTQTPATFALDPRATTTEAKEQAFTTARVD
ncbi:MFS transporter [Aureimonas fodinaquatilis]|uniref:MFS transporter n=2 Tax=Aureimonas fodinaquatilis TaxID=2565783 RepID=A0A5B0DZL3_9HYPH|nr:MFS transporter [Aureimonas fodinaquatilis]